MKNRILPSRMALVLAILLFSTAHAVELNDQAWFVGYAEAEITPEPRQVQMSGFGRERYANGALAPLLTQVVVLRDQNGHTGVLITADVLDFDRVMVEAIRRAIAHKYGIAPENTMLAASHTHWGPAIRFNMSYSLGAPNINP